MGTGAAANGANRIPKSFVLRSGKVGKGVEGLVQDLRRVMEPNTASRLQERKGNKLRDFLAMAGPLGVSHMLVLNQTETGTNLRMAKTPRGPTFTFRVEDYMLMRDVMAGHKASGVRMPQSGQEYLASPLLWKHWGRGYGGGTWRGVPGTSLDHFSAAKSFSKH